MKKLVIFSAGGFGLEVYWMAAGLRDRGKDWEIKGFLDDRPGILDGHDCGCPVLGSLDEYEPEPDDIFLCAVLSPKERKTAVSKIQEKKGTFTNLVHWTALGSWKRPAAGVIVGPYSAVSGDVSMGDFVCINSHAVIGHGAVLGDFCFVGTHALVAGDSRLGEGAVIHPHASLLPGVTIGDGAVVGAGSVVLRDVQPNQTVFGVPAMVVKP